MKSLALRRLTNHLKDDPYLNYLFTKTKNCRSFPPGLDGWMDGWMEFLLFRLTLGGAKIINLTIDYLLAVYT